MLHPFKGMPHPLRRSGECLTHSKECLTHSGSRGSASYRMPLTSHRMKVRLDSPDAVRTLIIHGHDNNVMASDLQSDLIMDEPGAYVPQL